MVSRMMMLMLMISPVMFGGEHGLTGNLRWDLLQSMDDSVQLISPVLTPSAEKQSPFMNGLFSLVLPGAGQYRTEHYTKAAIFLAAEAAFAAYAIISDNTADKRTAEFQKYAEEQWSPVRYAQWINTHGAADYGPAASIDLNKVRDYDFSEINEWERGLHKLGFSHSLPKFREQQYYELIGKYNQFKFGWKDYPADINGIPVSDGGRYDDMIPQQLLDYAVDRGKANDYYYAASFAVKALVINHVLSAFDAILSTASYNHSISATVQVRPIDRLEGERMMSELKVSVLF
jgi:hypothetical protein